jgi:hypothetical protein
VIPAAASPAFPPRGFFLKPVPFREFSLCLVGLLCIQYWAGTVVLLLGAFSAESVMATLTRISVMPVIEWYVLFGLTRAHGDRLISAPLALGSLALIAMASLALPHQRVAFLAETILLLAAWFRTPGLRRIAIVLVLIALQLDQGMTPLHSVVSWFDSRLLELTAAAIGHPVSRVGNLIFSPNVPGGLLVLAGCASTNLILPMALGLAALLLSSKPHLTGRDWGWIAATVAAGFAINIARLIMMLPSHAAYEYWHEGDGAAVISVAGMAVTLGAWIVATDQRKTKPPPVETP